MKKFGRGYVLDFAALMDEVRQPPDGANDRTPSAAPSTSLESTEASSTTTPIDHTPSTSSSSGGGGGGSGDAGSQSARSPVDPASPTEDDFGGESIKRKPTRMSVSRTGRCKNRDRQRLTVLQTDHFYAAPTPSDLGKVTTPSPSFACSHLKIVEAKIDSIFHQTNQTNLPKAAGFLSSFVVQPIILEELFDG